MWAFSRRMTLLSAITALAATQTLAREAYVLTKKISGYFGGDVRIYDSTSGRFQTLPQVPFSTDASPDPAGFYGIGEIAFIPSCQRAVAETTSFNFLFQIEEPGHHRLPNISFTPDPGWSGFGWNSGAKPDCSHAAVVSGQTLNHLEVMQIVDLRNQVVRSLVPITRFSSSPTAFFDEVEADPVTGDFYVTIQDFGTGSGGPILSRFSIDSQTGDLKILDSISLGGLDTWSLAAYDERVIVHHRIVRPCSAGSCEDYETLLFFGPWLRLLARRPASSANHLRGVFFSRTHASAYIMGNDTVSGIDSVTSIIEWDLVSYLSQQKFRNLVQPPDNEPLAIAIDPSSDTFYMLAERRRSSGGYDGYLVKFQPTSANPRWDFLEHDLLPWSMAFIETPVCGNGVIEGDEECDQGAPSQGIPPAPNNPCQCSACGCVVPQ